ncbi:MAG: RNA methylase, partial [uncultured bacterium]
MGDAIRYKYPKKTHFDVVIMEMLTTAMVDEFQIQAINNLHKQKVVSPDTVFIPHRLDSYASLAYKDFKMYGFEFKMVKHLWNNLSENHKVHIFSEEVLMHSVDFSFITKEKFQKVMYFPIVKDGTINCLRLSSRTFLSPGMTINDTETLNAPVVFPIEETKVKAGGFIKVKISYNFG